MEHLSNRIEAEYLNGVLKKLKKVVLQKELSFKSDDCIDLTEIKFLAETANLLAVSKGLSDKRKALEIAVALPKIIDNKGIFLNSFIILRKLGNYPGIKLLEERINIDEYKSLLSGISAFEEYVIEGFNERTFIDKKYLLTNFQNKVFDIMEKNRGVSLSAPTSAGKSFILLKYVIDLINKEPGITVVYIVPTKALIKQVMNDFLENINELNLKNIYVGSSSDIKSWLHYECYSNILVLTQERLYQLCTNEEINKLKIKMVVVDEAHNIQSGGRGILLEGAVNYVKELFPNAKILFSSPLVSNPEKFLSTFNIEKGKDKKDDFPLVIQNIIKVKTIGSKSLNISAIYQNEEIHIKTISCGIQGTAIAKRLANVAIKLWNSQTSIIYSNGPMDSVKVIRILFESNEFPRLYDERLEEFADFIEEYISNKYELAKFIRCGLAFHFGSLPSIIRSGIEDLFKEGAIKIVCCTSTLLEGLNMPAKNIFIYKPKKGSKVPMDSLSFWNLAGRAGRMGKDFSGNIFCIDPNDWEDNHILEKKQHQVLPSSEGRLKNDTLKFKNYIMDRKNPSGKDDYNEQLVSMVIQERINGNEMKESIFRNKENEKELIEIDEVTEIIINEFKPPLSLLKNLPGVLPDRINDFWSFLERNRERIEDFFPLSPVLYDKSVYLRLEQIIKLINAYFMNEREWAEKYIFKLTNNTYNWMIGRPMSKLIFYKNDFYRLGEKELTRHVQNQMDFINQNIRYEMVKFTQIYTEVLRTFLEENDMKEKIDKIPNISFYLEFGACTSPALEFMALGLSRELSLKLDHEFKKQSRYTSEFYLEWFKALDVTQIDVSNYLKSQIIKSQSIM
ncbi:DEAD/DEAH box helicase [Lysinibacillus sp. RS5]|uniref:DEAD/DEAH box helicase n=1 Tax=unclassified Lysinibacillus TaxID=2636778 RepID=UPI0035BE4B8B